jgi:hypothetical protein
MPGTGGGSPGFAERSNGGGSSGFCARAVHAAITASRSSARRLEPIIEGVSTTGPFE